MQFVSSWDEWLRDDHQFNRGHYFESLLSAVNIYSFRQYKIRGCTSFDPLCKKVLHLSVIRVMSAYYQVPHDTYNTITVSTQWPTEVRYVRF